MMAENRAGSTLPPDRTTAVSLAALLAGKVETRGRATAVVLSGGNVDPALFSALIEDRFDPETWGKTA